MSCVFFIRRCFWFLGGYPSGTLLDLSQIKIQQLSDCSISINPAGDADTGYYQCVANNTWGTAISDGAFIEVSCKTSW